MNNAATVNDARLSFDPERHVYTLGDRRLPSVTQILAEANVADFKAPWFSADVLERGTFVHQAILLDNEGDLNEDTLDPELVPHVAGWRAFRRDTGCVIEQWERPVCDPILGYAGTLDGIVRFTERGFERRVLIDIKRAFYPSAGPQTAAYRRCALKFYEQPVSLQRAIVELPGDGTYRYHPLSEHARDEAIFMSALHIVNWRRAHGYGTAGN